MTHETKKFDAEVGKVLHLMIHNLYANKEIFMRELISNASDACDKLRYLSQTDSALIADNPKFKITVSVDNEKKTITIYDTGIGMNKEDLEKNLGTIAKSGTQEFVKNLSGNEKKDSDLIGQFGVGFYSAFMVADRITVTSKKAGEDKVYSWHSDGLGEYSISDTDRDFKRGTEIVLHIKPEEEAFIDHFRLKHIVKSYSDHVAVPIFFDMNDNNDPVQINDGSALWKKSKSEISADLYKDFYKSVSHAADDPWITMHNKNEGVVEFTNLLFIPTMKTFDLFHPDRKRRVKLYIKRVFITDENIDIVPTYMRFLRGVVDSEDLPLNISRETLQHNAVIEKIKQSITKRVLSELKKKKDDARDEYLKFWENFGGALKEGLCEPISERDKILEVCVFRSALQDKMISLDEYLENCKQKNKTIYFLSGDDAEKLKNSPQIEGFINKGIDVLLFTDTVDDFWVNVNNTYKDIPFKSVTRADIDLENPDQEPSEKSEKQKAKEEQEVEKQYGALLKYFKDTLGALVKDVKISKKLTNSPACLAVGDGGMDIRMEKFLMEQKQLAHSSAKILEINPHHKIIERIFHSVQNNDKLNESETLVHLLFDQACILEGQQVADVNAFAERLSGLMDRG